jgi:hypothetical protein
MIAWITCTCMLISQLIDSLNFNKQVSQQVFDSLNFNKQVSQQVFYIINKEWNWYCKYLDKR